MIKLLGAMLVFFSATMIGFYQSGKYINRARQLRRLLYALERLETEIVYGLTPLPQALKNIGNHISDPVGLMFRMTASHLESRRAGTAYEAWTQALQEIWKKTALGKNEREILEQLGVNLGITDREDQIKHLRLAVVKLEEEEQNALEDQQRYAKMWRSLGILGGAFVVILLF